VKNRDDLENCLNNQALALGADYFGVADLAPAQGLIEEQGGEMMAQFPRAVSIGVLMPFAIVDQIPRHREKAVALAYRSHSYDILNFRLDQIASRLASRLQQERYRAFPVRASQTVDAERMYGLFSNKLAAHLAGLGWIGKSCLLVTPEAGPRVRWASILTDAPLATGEPLAERCGKCKVCVEACPSQAFSGRNFRADEPREARFDVFKCSEYFRQNEERTGARVCGMCVYSCPHGKKRGGDR
jgi:epoxyqueuosine reductase QueG